MELAVPLNPPSKNHFYLKHILVWVKCFIILVEVLAAEYPEQVPDFMAYWKFIVRPSRNFEGSAWVACIQCFRCQTASMRQFIPDSAFYNQTFTSRARIIPCCQHCLIENHVTTDCSVCYAGMAIGATKCHHNQNLLAHLGLSHEYC